MSYNEREEMFALGLVANGNGSHPLREHREFDEAVVAFSLESPDEVAVFLRREGCTRRDYRFRLVPSERPADGEDASAAEENPEARDVRLAVAERFLADALEILTGSPDALGRPLLAQALDRLGKSGRLSTDEMKRLRAFVEAWPEDRGEG